MRIITCLKYVPEMPALTEEFTICRDLSGKINPADMFAIEESVRIKERYGAQTIGLCMGVRKAATSLKHAIAMGLDQIILMSDHRFAGSDTFATSYILSQGIANIGKYDLVICGRQSTDGDTGQIAQELASHMGVPCLIHVVSVDFVENNKICCTVLTEQGYLKVKVQLPAVISVLKGINEPRVPSISGIIKAQRATVKVINGDNLKIDFSKCGLYGSPTRVKSVQRYVFEPKKTVDITDGYLNAIEAELQKARVPDSFFLESKLGDHAKRSGIDSHLNEGDEVWVLCEVHGGAISNTSLQLLAKAMTIVGEYHHLCAVLLDPVSPDVLDTLANHGVRRLYCVNKTCKTPAFDESKPNTLFAICKKYYPSIVLFESTVWGRWLAPLVAAKLKTGLTADCLDFKLEADTGNLIQTRATYGGSLIAEIICPNERPQMATVRANLFPNVSNTYCDKVTFEVIDISEDVCYGSRITMVSDEHSCSLSERLSNADIILCGGRGIGGKRGFDMLFELSHLIGGTVGATRYAVDAGWIDYSYQIGQTGTIVRPKVYLNFGVSGAFEHIVGMQHSKCVISVNQDPNAPIFAYSDYKVVDDCQAALTALIHYMTNKKG